MHPCQRIYELGANGITYGNTPGRCRITGSDGIGLPFHKWVKDTFTDHGYLKPGDIISNEALFCFDEGSAILQAKTSRDKPQRFRTYSHVVSKNQWHCFTKANKREIYQIITNEEPEIVCLSESGQRHLLFKHKPGFWQLEDVHVMPNIPEFIQIHKVCTDLMRMGFSQTEITNGQYNQARLLKCDLSAWVILESEISVHRRTSFFDFVTFLLFTDE